MNRDKIFWIIAERIRELENRVAILESKLSETHLDRTRIDFEGDSGTKVPTGENENVIERLKGKNNDEFVLDRDLIDFYEGENSWFPDVEFYPVEITNYGIKDKS